MFAQPSRLRVRSEFLRVATGAKGHVALATVQVKARDEQPSNDVIRVGFTASKKVGNAVARNRAKRRLREAVRVERDLGLRHGHDYVILARPDTVRAPWPALLSNLRSAIRKAHGGGRAKDGGGDPGRSRPGRD